MSEQIIMKTVEEAREEILRHFHVLESEEVHILEALGRVLAEEIVSDINIPPFDNSAMDGYAVQAADTRGASRENPVRLRVLADLAAGYTTEVTVEPGTAVRIMTGAPLPAGADAVVPFEDTDEGLNGRRRSPHEVLIMKEVEPRRNVRDAGEDVRQGETVLTAGTVLRPQEIGVLASLGRSRIRVVRRPRVAILATGDELVEIEEPLQPGKIRNSNSYSNYAQVLKYGGVPIKLPIARDTVADVRARIEEGLRQGADLFLTSGGVSVGEFDVVKQVLSDMGEVTFWRVRMQPGKPMAFGHIREVPLIGLPGNPVSAMVVFEQFARPAILRMGGHTRLRKPEVTAVLLDKARAYRDRVRFLRAIVTQAEDGTYQAHLTGPQGSGILTSMVKANGLAVIPAGPDLPPGSQVQVQMLDWPEVE